MNKQESTEGDKVQISDTHVEVKLTTNGFILYTESYDTRND